MATADDSAYPTTALQTASVVTRHHHCPMITGAGGLVFYQRRASLVFLTEQYRSARRTLRLPIPRVRDRSKSAHAFLVGAVQWRQQAIRAQLICIPIAYKGLSFLLGCTFCPINVLPVVSLSIPP